MPDPEWPRADSNQRATAYQTDTRDYAAGLSTAFAVNEHMDVTAAPLIASRRGAGQRRSSPTVAKRVPRRVLLTKREAAASMGMSLRSWERHVQPYVAVVVVGQLVQVRPTELERFVRARERAPLPDRRPGVRRRSARRAAAGS